MDLALFPLSMVAFPGEKVNLHIFEPRYKQLIQDCEDTGMSFGIPPFKSGMQLEIGTELRLERIVTRYADGKMDIVTTAGERFHILDFILKSEGKKYPSGKVQRFEDETVVTDLVLKGKVKSIIRGLFDVLQVEQDMTSILDFESIFEIAHKIGLSFQQEIELLKMVDENKRLTFVHHHLNEMMPIVKSMNEMKRKIKMNGHFKNPPLPDLY